MAMSKPHSRATFPYHLRCSAAEAMEGEMSAFLPPVLCPECHGRGVQAWAIAGIPLRCMKCGGGGQWCPPFKSRNWAAGPTLTEVFEEDAKWSEPCAAG